MRMAARLWLFQLRTATIRRSLAKMFQVQRKCKNKEFRQPVLKRGGKQGHTTPHHHTETLETTDNSASPPPFQLYPFLNSHGADFALRFFHTSSKYSCGFHPHTSGWVFSSSCHSPTFQYFQYFRSLIIFCKLFFPLSNPFTLTICYRLSRNSLHRCIQLCKELIKM